MELRLSPETEAKLNELAARSGRQADELVEDAMAAYLTEIAGLRELLDRRYDEFESGAITPLDGEQFFESLRQRKK